MNIINFGKHKLTKTGFNSYCRKCTTNKANEWTRLNSERARATRKRLYEKNKEKRFEYSKNWAKENPKLRTLINKRWKMRNPEKVKENTWRQNKILNEDGTLFKYKNFEDMLTQQKEKCAICNGTNPGKRDWNVDHDHKTGKVRGILCRSCNTGIGHLRDDYRICLSAVEYLKKTQGGHCA